MNIVQDFIPAGRRNRPGRVNPMLFVTVHETGNANNGANARAHANYLKGDTAANAPVSWHYTVDDTQTYQHLPENEDAFHAGDGAGNGNRQSIGIEICVNADGNFQKAVDRTAALVADICKRRNIPIENVRQHFNWSGKNCPQNIRAGRPYSWSVFLDKVKAEIEKQTAPSAPQASKTPIMGKSALTANQLANYLLSKNPSPKINCSALELARFFIEEGNTEGVRGDVAFCQSIHETGWFKYGGQVLPEQNNFAGIGAVNNSPVGAGAWFDNPQIGVRAQIHHLKAYALRSGYY